MTRVTSSARKVQLFTGQWHKWCGKGQMQHTWALSALGYPWYNLQWWCWRRLWGPCMTDQSPRLAWCPWARRSAAGGHRCCTITRQKNQNVTGRWTNRGVGQLQWWLTWATWDCSAGAPRPVWAFRTCHYRSLSDSYWRGCQVQEKCKYSFKFPRPASFLSNCSILVGL